MQSVSCQNSSASIFRRAKIRLRIAYSNVLMDTKPPHRTSRSVQVPSGILLSSKANSTLWNLHKCLVMQVGRSACDHCTRSKTTKDTLSSISLGYSGKPRSRNSFFRDCSRSHPTSWTVTARSFRRQQAPPTRLCTTPTRASTYTMRVMPGALPQSAEVIALPMWQVASTLESFPSDEGCDAWKQQSSAIIRHMRGEAKRPLSVARVPTSIPSSWQAPSALDELQRLQQAQVKAILESAKNLRKLFHQERWESAQADAETAATLTARRKEHVSTIKRAVFLFDPTGKDGKVPMNRQRKEVHRAARFGVGFKRTRATDSETSRKDYEQLLRSKTVSFNEHPEDAVVGKGSGCGKKTVDMHWRQWQGALSKLKLTRGVPLPVPLSSDSD